jgi:hypothetical protein
MRGLTISVVGLVGLVSLEAVADERRPLDAEALFEQARNAADAGSYASACPKFAESYRLDPTPGALLNLADCEEHLGHVATAWLNFRKAAEVLAPTDSRLPIAKQKVAALEKRLSRLAIRLAPNAPAGTLVKRDGEEITNAILGVAVPTDPGKHVVTVTAPGLREQRYEVAVAEGVSIEFTAEAFANGAPASAPASAPSTSPSTSLALTPPGQDDRGDLRTYGFIAGGIGAAGLLAGLVTRGLALGKKGSIADHCDANKLCDQTGLDAVSAADTLQTVSTVSLLVGVAGLGTGAYLILSNPKPSEPQVTLRPVVLGGGAGVSFRRSF